MKYNYKLLLTEKTLESIKIVDLNKLCLFLFVDSDSGCIFSPGDSDSTNFFSSSFDPNTNSISALSNSISPKIFNFESFIFDETWSIISLNCSCAKLVEDVGEVFNRRLWFVLDFSKSTCFFNSLLSFSCFWLVNNGEPVVKGLVYYGEPVGEGLVNDGEPVE